MLENEKIKLHSKTLYITQNGKRGGSCMYLVKKSDFFDFDIDFWARIWFQGSIKWSFWSSRVDLSEKKNKSFLWVCTTKNWPWPHNQKSVNGLFGQFGLNPVLKWIFSQKIDFLDFSRRYRPISWGIFRKYFFTSLAIFVGVWTMFWGLYG